MEESELVAFFVENVGAAVGALARASIALVLPLGVLIGARWLWDVHLSPVG